MFSLTSFLDTLTSVNPENVPIYVAIVVGVLLLGFIVRYAIPSFRVSARFKQKAKAIRLLGNEKPAQQLEKLDALFSDKFFAHPWSEFKESLHRQFEFDENSGQKKISAIRSTAPSSAWFTEPLLVEIPLYTEAFKHLPGILTGIGIIGTFSGLMIGLHHFDPSTPEQVSASVANLLRDVLYAFLGSAFAITFSILVTMFEKWRLAQCYKNLELLTASIDQLFEGGVGEDYLSQLLSSTKENTTHARQLKDGLVTDLREMLQNLVDSQMRENQKLAETLSTTYRESGQQFAEQVSGAIETSLKNPLDKIAGVVQTASGDQSHRVQSMLENVLTAFMSKMDNTFGQQFTTMQEMMGRSVEAIQSMQSGFSTLLQDMRQAGDDSRQGSAQLISQLLSEMKSGQQEMQAGMNEMLRSLQESVARIGAEGEGAGERMAQQLEKIFADSEAREKAMAEQMRAFIEAIQSSVQQGQNETMEKMAASVDTLGSHMATLFAQLENGQQQLNQQQNQAQNLLIGNMSKGVEALTQNLAGVFSQLESGQKQMSQTQEQGQRVLHEETQQLLARSEAREQAAAEQQQQFMTSLQQTMHSSQDALREKMTSGIDQLGSQLGSLFGQLEDGQKSLSQQQQSAQSALQQEAQRIISQLESQVESLMQMLREQQSASGELLQRMAQNTTRHLEEIQTGADKMRVAADRFEAAGDRVAEANQLTAEVLNSTQQAGRTLSGASAELGALIADYRNTREVVANAITALETLINRSHDEQSSRSRFVDDLKAYSERLQQYNREAQEFLHNIAEVMGTSFESFTTGVENGLNRSLQEMDTQLTKAAGALSSSVEIIGESVDTLETVLRHRRA